MNNRRLLFVFIGCLVLFLLGKFFTGSRTSSFDPSIIAVDTTKVDHLKFIAGGPAKEEFELLKLGANTWQAVQGNKKVDVPLAAIQSLLTPLASLDAQRIVTRDPAKYAEYEIGDEQAARVTIWEGKKQVADLFIGGFRFDQVARTASSFIRHAGKLEVYLIDGFASMGLKARFDQFRDKKLVKTDANDLSSLDWTDKSGNKQVLQKQDGIWYYAGMEAVDSTSIEAYLSGLAGAQGSSFSNLTSTDGLPLIETLTLTGNNMLEPTVLTAYASQDTLQPFLIHSSANPDAMFNSDSTGLYKRLFSDLRQFRPNGK